MRQGQDVYARNGLDISKDPAILATLFNLGKYEERAANIQPGYVPRINYIGWYMNEKMLVIENILYGE
jgi:hypothetical protein